MPHRVARTGVLDLGVRTPRPLRRKGLGKETTPKHQNTRACGMVAVSGVTRTLVNVHGLEMWVRIPLWSAAFGPDRIA